MSEYIITVDENDERWHYVEQQYTHFFGYPIAGEIVRCMDCAWFTNSSHYGAYCTNFGSPLHDDYDGFCKWGERRDA